jgi:hypothetical protein
LYRNKKKKEDEDATSSSAEDWNQRWVDDDQEQEYEALLVKSI